jgi:C-terminal processing protease CtpA/Prc
LREEERVGVVLRGATEVEARAAGLAPGGGAVVVGLSTDSPWRAAGIVFEDLIVAQDGEPVAAPEQVLDRVRALPDGGELELVLVRAGEKKQVRAPVSRRASEFRHFAIPLIVSYERERGSSRFSCLLGLFRLRRTSAAWDVRLLWLMSFGGGDSDRLEEVRF